jgi:hypothetical protein
VRGGRQHAEVGERIAGRAGARPVVDDEGDGIDDGGHGSALYQDGPGTTRSRRGEVAEDRVFW